MIVLTELCSRIEICGLFIYLYKILLCLGIILIYLPSRYGSQSHAATWPIRENQVKSSTNSRARISSLAREYR